MSNQDKVVEVYKQKLLIHEVAKEMDMPWHVVYRHLKKSGVLDIETRMVSGSVTDRMGAFYENEFRRLVPLAECQNDKRKQFEIDFTVGNAKIDVKSSTLHERGKGRPYWKFEVGKRQSRERVADYYVCFGKNPGEDPRDYVIFCFPFELLRGLSVSVVPSNPKNEWMPYKISPENLTAMFAEIAND